MADHHRRPQTSVADTPRLEQQASEEAIRNRAHEIYTQRGGEHGRDCDDWLQAERELRREQDE
jgi:hypothetical protein